MVDETDELSLVCTGPAADGKGSATDFKVGGTKQDSRAERAKKKICTPTFQKCVGVQATPSNLHLASSEQ